MIRHLLLGIALGYSVFLESYSLTLSLFSHHPPYRVSHPYLFHLESKNTLLTLMQISSSCITSKILLPHDQTLLWVKPRRLSLDLVQKLKEQGNHIIPLETKTFKALESAYLNTHPDMLLLPVNMEKKVKELMALHPKAKPLVVLFYPQTHFQANDHRPLSSMAWKKKLGAYPHLRDWVQTLGYAETKTPHEHFLIKKLSLSKQGRVLKTKAADALKDLLQSPSSDLIEVLAIAESQEDLHLAMGGLLYELEKKRILPLALYTKTKSYNKAWRGCLEKKYSNLYLFVPEAYLKKFSKHLKNLLAQCESLWVISYHTPWKEPWNLYHYPEQGGSLLYGAIGQLHLGKQIPDPKSLQRRKAECFYVKTFFHDTK